MIVTNSLPMGGRSRVILNLAGGLRDRGHRVTVVTMRTPEVPDSWLPEGVSIAALGDVRLRSALPRLAQLMRRDRPDGVIGTETFVNLLTWLASRGCRPRPRVLLAEHVKLSESLRPKNRLDRLMPRVVRFVYRRSDAVIGVSEGLSNEIRTFLGGKGRVVTVHNPIVPADVEARASEPVAHPWFAPGSPPVVLAVARLDPVKDLDTLLRAVALVAERREIRLVVLGEGPLRSHLEGLARDLGISEIVDLPGEVANPYPYMARSAVLALTSRAEAMPMVLVEAMSCGCPVVSTDCRYGPSEIMVDGEYGPLVEVGDAEGLAGAVECTLDDPVPPARLRSRAGMFSVAASSTRYEDVLMRSAHSTRSSDDCGIRHLCRSWRRPRRAQPPSPEA